MKYLILFIAALSTQVSIAESILDTYIKANRGTFKYPMNELQLREFNFNKTLMENRNIALKLGSIKYEIINGNLEKAKLLLLQSKYSDDFSRNVQYRYLSIIHFIQGNYKVSQEYLTKKGMYNIVTDDTICLLRTLNYIILDSTSKAKIEWNRCVDATINDSPTLHVWMNTILKLKLNDEPNITAVPLKNVNIENERGDYLRLFLKLALYLNQQDKIFERLSFLSVAAFEDTEIRELIGMLYYREGKLVKAFEFIEDLESPNSENIKGNLYLAQKKYQMAYGQFKLALKRKVDSQNSLERIIPVSWILKQWEDGLEYIEKLQVTQREKYTKLAIKAAFLTQAGKYSEAAKTLEQIVKGSNNAQSSEVNQLYTYNSVMFKDKDKTEIYADYSCKFKDGINCWLQYHLAIWDNFPITIQRDENIFENITDLNKVYTAAAIDEPLKESIYINQKDIEELDNDIIQLLPDIID